MVKVGAALQPVNVGAHVSQRVSYIGRLITTLVAGTLQLYVAVPVVVALTRPMFSTSSVDAGAEPE